MSLRPLVVVGPCSRSLNVYVLAGCGVFGRDESGESDFAFTQQQVDMLIEKWSQSVRAVGWNKTSKPTASTIMVVELCISDVNKPLLLANSAFVPYVVDALLLVRGEDKHVSQCLPGFCDTSASSHRPQLRTVALAPSILNRIHSIRGQA